MTDVLDHAIRTSLAALLDTAPDPHEKVPAGEPSVVADVSHRPRRSLVAVGSLATILLLAGLVVIAGRDHDQPASSPRGDTRWLIDDLPDGWVVAAVNGPGPIQLDEANFGTPVGGSLYATAEAPLGPVLSITSDSMAPTATVGNLPAETNFSEFMLDGRRAALADRDGGTRVLYLEVDQLWAKFQAREMTDDQLRAVATTVTFDANGLAAVDPAALPSGVSRLPGDLADIGYLTDGGTSSSYGDPSAGAVSPMSMWATRSLLTAAWFGLDSTGQRQVDINGHKGVLLTSVQASPGLTAVVWEQNGLSFSIIGNTRADKVLLDAARSVRPATETEWAELPSYEELQSERLPEGADPTAPVGTTPPDTVLAEAEEIAPTTPNPNETVPEVAAPFDTDVASAPTIEDVSASETTYRDELASGVEWTSTVSIVFDYAQFSSSVDGRSVAETGQQTDAADGVQIVGITTELADFVTAASVEPNAYTLRVTTRSGSRISQLMHINPSHPDVRLAVIAVEPTEWAFAEILDGRGTTIDTATP